MSVTCYCIVLNRASGGCSCLSGLNSISKIQNQIFYVAIGIIFVGYLHNIFIPILKWVVCMKE